MIKRKTNKSTYYYYVVARYYLHDFDAGGYVAMEDLLYKTRSKKRALDYLSNLINKKAEYGKTYQKNRIKLKVAKSKHNFNIFPDMVDKVKWMIRRR